jgi:hypothetical protein
LRLKLASRFPSGARLIERKNFMTRMTRISAFLIAPAVALAVSLSACSKPTPTQQAVDAIKDAAVKTGEAAKDVAGQAADAAKDAADKAADAAKDAAVKVEGAAQSAADAAKTAADKAKDAANDAMKK